MKPWTWHRISATSMVRLLGPSLKLRPKASATSGMPNAQPCDIVNCAHETTRPRKTGSDWLWLSSRCGDRDAALETILAIDVSELGRDSQALMKLAHMKRFFGAADYIEDAYLSRRFGINDPATHLAYFRLFQGREEDWEEPAVVEPGCSVLIKSDDEQSWWQILEDGEERYESRELSPSDDLAIRLLGRSVGDVLLLREEFGGLSCEITAIQSKYVRAYQETAEEFSTRFPGNRAFSFSGLG